MGTKNFGIMENNKFTSITVDDLIQRLSKFPKNMRIVTYEKIVTLL